MSKKQRLLQSLENEPIVKTKISDVTSEKTDVRSEEPHADETLMKEEQQDSVAPGDKTEACQEVKTAPEVIAIDDDPEASQQSSLDASLDDGSCEQTGDESEVKRLAQELLKKWKDLKVSRSQEKFKHVSE